MPACLGGPDARRISGDFAGAAEVLAGECDTAQQGARLLVLLRGVTDGCAAAFVGAIALLAAVRTGVHVALTLASMLKNVFCCC